MPSKQRKSPGAHRRGVTPWPLRGAKYLSTPSVAPNSVSQGSTVETLRGALGLRPGRFDHDVREAVMDAQVRLELPVTGVVTEVDWDAIVNPVGRGPARVRKRRSAAPAGSVDGADKPDAPAKGSGKLNPPQGPQ